MDGKGNFTICTWETYDSIKDPMAFAVYFTLKRFADFNTGENCYISDARAAELSGMSITTFKRKRNILKKLGWITWKSGKATGTTNLYLVHETLGAQQLPLVVEELPLGAKERPGSRQTATGVGAKERQPRDSIPRDSYLETLPAVTEDDLERENSVKTVFDYWKSKLDNGDSSFSPKKKELISARLLEGFTPEQLKTVIDFVKTNSFWKDKSTIETIFKDLDRVEQLLSNMGSGKKAQKMIITDEERRQAHSKGKWFKDETL